MGAYGRHEQPLVTPIVLLFILASRRRHPDSGDPWHLPFASPSNSRWAWLTPVLASSMFALGSASLIRIHASPDPSWVGFFGSCLFLLQCVLFGAVPRIKVEMPHQSKHSSDLQQDLLGKVSTYSFALSALVVAVANTQKRSLHPSFLVLGVIRALHYFLQFNLVCLPQRHSV